MRRQFEGIPTVPRKSAGGPPRGNIMSQAELRGTPGFNPAAGGIPMPAKKDAQKGTSKADILQGLAIGGLSGLGGPQGMLGAAAAQIIPMLVERLKKRPATQSKKGGGPVVKGKTKNEKMPQIPKGTMKKGPAKYKSGGKMKKGC